MKYTAEQIAEVIGGKVEGNPKAEVNDLAKIEEGSPGTLTFLANPKYTNYIYETQASICIVNEDFEPQKPVEATLIRVKDAYKAFTSLLEFHSRMLKNKVGVEQPHFVSATAQLGEDIYLGAFSYIGENSIIGNNVKIYPQAYIGDNVKIGDNTTIHSGVKLYRDTVIGNNCIIHGNAVIGADGFGFMPDENGVYSKVEQIGNVVIDDDVEVGASTTIDRATLGSTRIKKGVKLDNQIQIAHNVEIGKHTVLAAQTGVAGSTKIGKHCLIGGQVGIVGHLKIGDRVKIQAQTGVTGNIEDGSVLQGSPSLSYTGFNRSYIYFKDFPNIVKRLSDLEKKIENNG